MDTLSVHCINPIKRDQLRDLRQALQKGPILITTHANPDPDALAAGKAINQLISIAWGIPAKLIYNGLVGRAENRAVLKLLTPEWEHVDACEDYSNFSCVVFVDCQPGSRNMVPIDENLPMIVIDHHYPIVEQTQRAVYADIRPNVGSTVTMIYQYLDAAKVSIDPILATAMFFGLRADTNGLSRGSTLEDGLVYVKLLERLDQQLLLEIESAGLAQEYYQAFYQGMQNARVYGKAIVVHLGEVHRPDLAAELADLLFRYESVHAALCSGVYKEVLHFSIRTGLLDQDAGILVQDVIFPPGEAGGHGIMAGGQIPLNEEGVDTIVLKLERRFLGSVGESDNSKPLLQDRGIN
ncbi:MAG: DHH family phosphoesterase [Planctomycetes bacterium]|nr:DHH family phosphoesterase [Planctomycetota bacterium]